MGLKKRIALPIAQGIVRGTMRIRCLTLGVVKGVLMKKTIFTVFVFLSITMYLTAQEQEWAISFNGNVTFYSTQTEFNIANTAIARELRTLCRQGVPIYWITSLGGAGQNFTPPSLNIWLQAWEVARRNIATDEQLKIAIREGYWFGIVPQYVPPGTGDFQKLKVGNYSYIIMKGRHYIIEPTIVTLFCPR